MHLSILKKLILFFLIVTALFAGTYFLLKKGDPVLKISGNIPYDLHLNNDLHKINESPAEIVIKPGFYNIYAHKENYSSFTDSFNIEKEEKKEITFTFEFIPYLETLQSSADTQILVSDYQEGKCSSRIGTGSTIFTYCYDEQKELGNLFFSEDGKTRLLTSLNELSNLEIAFNQDSQQVLLYQAVHPDSSGYLVDLETGFKDKIWEGQKIFEAQPYETGFLLLVLDEEAEAESLSEGTDIHFTPSLLYFLDTETKEKFLITTHIDYGHYCAVEKAVYFLVEDTRPVEKSIETFSDLKEELKNTFSSYVEKEYIYRVMKKEIPSLQEVEVAIIGSDIADPEILSCSKEEIVLRNYDDTYYRIALEESAMKD